LNLGKSNSFAGPPTKKFIVAGSMLSAVIFRIWHLLTLITREISFERKGRVYIWTLACNKYVPMSTLRPMETLILFMFRIAEVCS
jgi:hypothetical protein